MSDQWMATSQSLRPTAHYYLAALGGRLLEHLNALDLFGNLHSSTHGEHHPSLESSSMLMQHRGQIGTISSVLHHELCIDALDAQLAPSPTHTISP